MAMEYKRCGERETNALISLFAAIRTLQFVEEQIPDRLGGIEATGRLKQAMEELDQIATELTVTYPESKRQAMLNQRGHVYMRLELWKPVRVDKSKTVVEVRHLDRLVQYAHHECELCAHPDRCSKCELGKTFDECCPNERRHGESWLGIDVAAYEEE